MMRSSQLVFSLILLTTSQLFSQSIRGIVLDKATTTPLAGATVDLPELTPARGAICNADGRFVIPDIAPGRYQVRVQYFGYETEILPDVLVSNGKDADVQIEMEETTQMMETVTITDTKKDKPVSKLAKVSAVALHPESVTRFSGGRSNVARMAANFAGVGATDDYQNQIVVRGNSPVGLLWRLEGVPIPNPGHLSPYGNSGGSFSAINPNVLRQSEFLTGAFPAEFGNTIAGVMNMNFRSGNKEKYEFMAQIGAWSGVEASLEGPLFRKQNGSFILGYRYSFVDLFQRLGVNFAGRFVPQYQDLNWKMDFGKGRHRFVFFGLSGDNHIFIGGAEIDPENPYNPPTEDSELGGSFITTGFRHQWMIDSVSYLHTTVSFSNSKLDSKGWDLDAKFVPTLSSEGFNRERALRLATLWQRRHTKRLTFRAGALAQGNSMETQLLLRDESAAFIPVRNFDGLLKLFEVYAQVQYKVKKRYSLNFGLHSQYLPLNGSTSLEPRAAWKLKLPADNDLVFAYGLHTQTPSLEALMYSTPDGNLGNKNLNFLYSSQGVISWVKKWNDGWRSRVEAYYQGLTDIPVHRHPDGYSLLNLGAAFDPGDLSMLESSGKGRNYGLELTLNKSYSNGFYALFTASLFESEYRGSDGVWRNTAFNTNYVLNGLVGKEFTLRKNLTFTFDGKVGSAGGRRYTPILLDESIAAMRELRDETRPYSAQYPMFFRLDAKFGIRWNMPRVTHGLYLDFTNLTNRKNVFGYRYFPRNDDISTQYQLGFTPDFVYRVQF